MPRKAKKMTRMEKIVFKHLTSNPECTSTVHSLVKNELYKYKFGSKKKLLILLHRMEEKKLIKYFRLENNRNGRARAMLWGR